MPALDEYVKPNEVDSESAICIMCGTQLNTQIEYKIHDYFKFRKVNAKLTRLRFFIASLEKYLGNFYRERFNEET
jgi:hypothetical protein